MTKTVIVDGIERFGGVFRSNVVKCDGCGKEETTNRHKYTTPCYASIEFDLFKRGWFSHSARHYCPECVDV